MRPLDDYIKNQLNEHLRAIEEALGADGLTILSPILPGLDIKVRDVVEDITEKKNALVIIHDTPRRCG